MKTINILQRNKKTYEPSSHSGSTKLPPPLTAGIQDFLGATAAAITSRLGADTAPLMAAPTGADKVWLLLLPVKKGDPNPFNTAADVAAAISSLLLRL